MRKKKAWEAVLPPMDTPANIRLRTAIVTAIEIDEWAFRESASILLSVILCFKHNILENNKFYNSRRFKL